jgi:type VI secretion system protein ImpF
MAEDLARELLQPALLDRLTDDARSITVFEVRTTAAHLARLGLNDVMVTAALVAIGLQETAPVEEPSSADAGMRLQFSAPGRTVGLAQVKNAQVRAPRANRGVELSAFCEITAAIRPNIQRDGVDRRGISMRRLRECVLRDLSALFNAINLEASVELESYPLAAQSVLNFGLPNLAGQARSSLAPARLAERIRRAIETFEPRLSQVRVTPEVDGPTTDAIGGIAFRIEAELWGDPLPQHVEVRTRIDLGSGAARVDDLGGG